MPVKGNARKNKKKVQKKKSDSVSPPPPIQKEAEPGPSIEMSGLTDMVRSQSVIGKGGTWVRPAQDHQFKLLPVDAVGDPNQNKPFTRTELGTLTEPKKVRRNTRRREEAEPDAQSHEIVDRDKEDTPNQVEPKTKRCKANPVTKESGLKKIAAAARPTETPQENNPDTVDGAIDGSFVTPEPKQSNETGSLSDLLNEECIKFEGEQSVAFGTRIFNVKRILDGIDLISQYSTLSGNMTPNNVSLFKNLVMQITRNQILPEIVAAQLKFKDQMQVELSNIKRELEKQQSSTKCMENRTVINHICHTHDKQTTQTGMNGPPKDLSHILNKDLITIDPNIKIHEAEVMTPELIRQRDKHMKLSITLFLKNLTRTPVTGKADTASKTEMYETQVNFLDERPFDSKSKEEILIQIPSWTRNGIIFPCFTYPQSRDLLREFHYDWFFSDPSIHENLKKKIVIRPAHEHDKSHDLKTNDHGDDHEDIKSVEKSSIDPKTMERFLYDCVHDDKTAWFKTTYTNAKNHLISDIKTRFISLYLERFGYSELKPPRVQRQGKKKGKVLQSSSATKVSGTDMVEREDSEKVALELERKKSMKALKKKAREELGGKKWRTREFRNECAGEKHTDKLPNAKELLSKDVCWMKTVEQRDDDPVTAGDDTFGNPLHLILYKSVFRNESLPTVSIENSKGTEPVCASVFQLALLDYVADLVLYDDEDDSSLVDNEDVSDYPDEMYLEERVRTSSSFRKQKGHDPFIEKYVAHMKEYLSVREAEKRNSTWKKCVFGGYFVVDLSAIDTLVENYDIVKEKLLSFQYPDKYAKYFINIMNWRSDEADQTAGDSESRAESQDAGGQDQSEKHNQDSGAKDRIEESSEESNRDSGDNYRKWKFIDDEAEC